MSASDPIDRRVHDERRMTPRGGRRANDQSWTTGQLAAHIGMSTWFVRSEIRCGELVASQFGREFRIATIEVRRYLVAKGFPVPSVLAES